MMTASTTSMTARRKKRKTSISLSSRVFQYYLSSLHLFAVESEEIVDDDGVLRIYDAGRHQSEHLQLIVAECEEFDHACRLFARVIAAKPSHFQKVELIVIKACPSHLII